MSIAATQTVMDGYFSAMNAGADFSTYFHEDVTWLMVDSDQEVRGPQQVHDYVLNLHSRMRSGHQGGLVVADGHALLEGSRVNAVEDGGHGLRFCLVYDVQDDRITAMRCYGSLAWLMSKAEDHEPGSAGG